MTTAKQAIARFLSHVGTIETPPGSNRTTFGAAYGMNGVPWCDISLCEVGREASGSYGLLGRFSYTVNHAQWFVSKSRWGTTPRPGAAVFFDWNGGKSIGGIDHVGMVIAALPNGLVRTVEGNAAVAGKTDGVWVHDRSQQLIVGYGYPAYATAASGSTRAPTPAQPAAQPTAVPAFPGVTKLGSRGPAVSAVQQRLHDRGWSIATDSVFGSVTEHVVKLFQRERGLADDGVVGPLTWKALWTSRVT